MKLKFNQDEDGNDLGGLTSMVARASKKKKKRKRIEMMMLKMSQKF